MLVRRPPEIKACLCAVQRPAVCLQHAMYCAHIANITHNFEFIQMWPNNSRKASAHSIDRAFVLINLAICIVALSLAALSIQTFGAL